MKGKTNFENEHRQNTDDNDASDTRLYQGFYKFSTPFEWLKKYQCTEGLKFLLFSLKVDTRRISTSRYINFALM